jgi:hypothetical protein
MGAIPSSGSTTTVPIAPGREAGEGGCVELLPDEGGDTGVESGDGEVADEDDDPG